MFKKQSGETSSTALAPTTKEKNTQLTTTESKSTSQECPTCHHGLKEGAKSNGSNGSKGSKTRVVVKYDVGFNNSLYIRGKGANLNWEKGIPLKNLRADEWVWETETNFPCGEFKILINDKHYENGTNHHLHCGSSVQVTPHF